MPQLTRLSPRMMSNDHNSCSPSSRYNRHNGDDLVIPLGKENLANQRRSRKIMSHALDLFTEDIRSGKVFFFVGSGVSLQSRLPSVDELLGATMDHFLPTISQNHNEREWVLEKVQPEAFYGVLLEIFRGDLSCLGFWAALHPGHWAGKLECLPNLVHAIIVKSAYEAGMPVFTTNFDTMLESACEKLGLPYRVFLPEMVPPAPTDRAQEVLICKVHGSVQHPSTGAFSPESLRTTMTGIASFNPRWVEYLSACMRKGHICFLGYSGRDVDYFPQICETVVKGALTPYWFDRFGTGSTAQATLTNAETCGARKIESFPSEVFPDIWPRVFSGSIPSLRDSTGDLQQVLNDLEQQMPKMPVCEDLLWLRILESQGRCAEAWELANDLLARIDSLGLDLPAKIQLYESSMNMARERARFTTYRKRARQLLKMTHGLKLGSPARANTALNARVQITSSFQMEISNGIGLNPDVIDAALLLYVMLRFRIDIIRGDLSIRIHPRNASASRFILEETRVREAAIYVRLCSLSHNLGKLIQPPLLKRLRGIAERAYHDGNTSSRVGAAKYLFRLTGDSREKGIGDAIAGLSGDISARTILQRDESRSQPDPTIALQGYRESAENAQLNGNPLNEIKIRLAILTMLPPGAEARREWARVSSLLDEVESWNLQRAFTKLKDRFRHLV